MKIEVLGTGCPKCKMLHRNVEKAAEELGMKPEIEHVTDIKKIMEYGVMMTPALVVDGVIKCEGRVPEAKEITGWLR